MVDEKYKWLYSYTYPCTLGNKDKFAELLERGRFISYLKGDYSRKKVRDYFFGPHNREILEEINKMEDLHGHLGYAHLAIPYQVEERKEALVCSVCEPFFEIPKGLSRLCLDSRKINGAENRGVFEKKDEIVVVHLGFIAESCSREDIVRYNHLYEQQNTICMK